MWPSLDEIWKIMQFRHYNTYLKNKRNFQLSDYFAQTTHCKSSLKIILRGEPTFYDQRLVSIGNFGTSYWVQLWSPKNWFCSLFSLITKSILTLYCLRIPKQLVSRILQKMDDHILFSTGLCLCTLFDNFFPLNLVQPLRAMFLGSFSRYEFYRFLYRVVSC